MFADHAHMLPHLALDALAAPYARGIDRTRRARHIEFHGVLGDRQADDLAVGKGFRLPYGAVLVAYCGQTGTPAIDESLEQ